MMRVFVLIVLLLAGGAAAWAAETAGALRALLDDFSAHRRVAAGYLRTGNAELGAIEIERLRERWQQHVSALPQELRRDSALKAALDETDALTGQALRAADAAEIEQGRLLLDRAAAPLARWRKSKGIRLFADCIGEISATYERLDVYRLETPRLDNAGIATAITAAAVDVETALQRCEAEAAAALRREPEFRRLIDGMLNSLRQVPDAARRRDNALLHRLLIEQRSFERLLAFRYG